MYHSSRSSTETYFDCPKRRYLRYHHLGYGVDPILVNVPLTTGSAVHHGVGIILKAVKKGIFSLWGDNSQVIDFAVKHAQLIYKEIVGDAGFKINENFDDGGYLYNEQLALTEGLVRAYAIIEAPYILQNYSILAVEKDIQLDLLPFSQLDYPVRADAILQSTADNRIYVYSLKTTKRWDERIQSSYRVDLQGITELAGVRQVLKGTNYEPLLAGIAYCFLVKGNFTQKLHGGYETDSPLIRGWKYEGPNFTEYAHSYWFPNPNNPSGKGRLPNNFSEFKVWDQYPGGVKQWVSLLASGEIQSSCPNPLTECVRSPLPSWRANDDIDRTLCEVAQAERRVIVGLEQIAKRDKFTNTLELMSGYFPRNRRACYWPTNCDYIPVCHNGVTNVLEGGYKLRVPHHETERNEFYQIQGGKK